MGCLSLLIVSFDDQRVILIVQRYYVNLKICFPKLYHVSPSRTVHLKDTLGKETMEGKGEAIMQTGFFFFSEKTKHFLHVRFRLLNQTKLQTREDIYFVLSLHNPETFLGEN